MSQEKKFKVGDSVVIEPAYHGAAVRRGIVATVGMRWVTVSFGGRAPFRGERWDAVTGRMDSEFTNQPLLTKAEHDELEAVRATRAKLRAVGVSVDERVTGHIPVLDVWAALEPLVTARTAAAKQDPQAP